MKAPAAVLVALLSIGVIAAAQSPTFEVASVKKSAPLGSGPMLVLAGAIRGESWNATNATLRMMIRGAYGPDFQMEGQIVGGPSWFDTDRFDIVAKVAGKPTIDETRAMVKALLADRFKLVTHTEQRELQVFALVPARSDGRLGPQLRPAGIDCNELREARRTGKAPPAAPPDPGGPPAPCTFGFRVGPVLRMESGGSTMAQLASLLSQSAGRPVIDRTGLSGDFTFTLEFARDPTSSSPLGPPPPGPAIAPPSDMPSVFTAVQDQLGLKLDPRRERIDVLVVDNAEQPTPD